MRRRPNVARALALVTLVLAVALAACGPMSEEQAMQAPVRCAETPSGPSHEVDPFKEILIVDEAVITSAAARNRDVGAVSFRRVVSRTAGDESAASEATLGWLEHWGPKSLRCDWLRARSENECDAACDVCREWRLDLAQAPFRLLAVANRIDMAHEADGRSEAGAGEGRLIYALTQGPGDDPRSPALPVTVIFEFRLHGDPAVWAARWHALGAHAAFDARYVRELTDLTDRFVSSRHAARVRVHDAASGPRAVMREFLVEGALDAPHARFRPWALHRTPDHSLDGSDVLRDYVLAHQDGIVSGRYDLPSLESERVELGERWRLPGVDEHVRRAFAASTCDGCHGVEHPAIDGGFHVSPHARGAAKLSRFLFDPERPGQDELSRRAAILTRLACAK